MDVKLVSRTLDLFEVFAAVRRPLSLTELAQRLDAPMSSCLALARTLVNRGYLYEVRRRGGYYPTPRLARIAAALGATDPVVEIARPHLIALRDATGETAVLGKIDGTAVVYLDVVESNHAIRYTRKPGDMRPLHANSIGKAIFGELPDDAQRTLGHRLSLDAYTDATVTSLPALIEQGALAHARGFAENFGESAPELSALAVAFAVHGEWYGVSIAGPTERIRVARDAHAAALAACKAEILADC
ncbi:IclR family transcriptional regulator [Burkholderia oklahomensis]|uniref:Bacterial transcriptional regulator family protein n=1 Tax=Burkholderia oklahomensis TaxID=342113 RepID=A0AAI8B3G7_9BURK|nr:IclR family transcriptional regulator [Burkholderia oklahomensis]AIO64881.1 bacterial transcriptional regulator family protein [Burkholderia oklahomensis]AJX31625.1 iclR helix-turn-helix domain protein [Burkholderia oklahomensis C6786]AOI42442.1 IclR family transcriptional regulator [Burkholderia oklahomensis EO147]AOI46006.1 IclR family transcriptional regulator [Burkholderia oklahomensis C6786]KUY54735.1 IclR family transcriptional regulator [Burkholderia oklahomensis C6786]